MTKELVSFVISLSLSCIGMQNGIACESTNPIWQTMRDARITLTSENGKSHELLVKVANSRIQHRAGFQNICTELIQQWAILFVFSKRQRLPFHMRNVKSNLDLAFLDTDGRLLELKKMKRDDPADEAYIYQAEKPFSYALETASGRLFSIGMDKGLWWLVIDPSWGES